MQLSIACSLAAQAVSLLNARKLLVGMIRMVYPLNGGFMRKTEHAGLDQVFFRDDCTRDPDLHVSPPRGFFHRIRLFQARPVLNYSRRRVSFRAGQV